MFLSLRFCTFLDVFRDHCTGNTGNHDDSHANHTQNGHDVVEENHREKFSEDDSGKLQTRCQQYIAVTESERETTLSKKGRDTNAG